MRRATTPGWPHLVVPGHRQDFAEKAHGFGADFILWDLEDGVPIDCKAAAWETVVRLARPGDAVRIAPNTPNAALFSDVLGLELWHAKAEQSGGGVHIIESPSAVLVVRDVVIDPEVTGLAFGAYDFAAACGVAWDSPLVEHARLQVLLAAKAAGIPAYDAPCKDLDPGLAFAAACRSKALGFDSKGVIHPAHLEGTRRAWAAGTMPADEARDVAALESAGATRGRFYIPAEIAAARRQVDQEAG